MNAPGGTSVGVDDPYVHVDRCDHLTDDGRCRLAVQRPEADPAFAAERRAADYRCLAVPEAEDVAARDSTAAVTGAADRDGGPDWAACPHFRSTTDGRECRRCGLAERRDAHSSARPLIEEHHLVYPDAERDTEHEVTVALCRWCHSKVHESWARIDDDASPDPEAIAATEGRRSEELAEARFETAAERFAGEERWVDDRNGDRSTGGES